MSGFLCTMVGATFSVAAVAEVLRSKKAITAVGNAQVDTAQSKFGGASALFDGTGDYLNVGETGDFAFGTGNFTVETWIYNTKSSSSRKSGILSKRNFDNINAGGWGLYLTTNDGKIGWEQLFSGGSAYEISGTVSASTWTHIAVVRNSTTMKIYVNGTEGASWTDSTNYTNVNQLKVGTFWDSTQNNTPTDSVAWQGSIDEIRISNTARYTSNFTAPTTAFVNDSNTLLLIHANGTDASTFFEDDNGTVPFSTRTAKTITAVGNAQVDTAQFQYGSSSAQFDGTGDYLLSTANSDYNFGTSSFTIEYWIRFNVAPTLYVPIALRPTASIGNGEWWCEITNAEKKMYWGFKNQAGTQYYVNLALAGTAFATGQWYHIALVNNAGTAQMYVNGTATGSTTSLSGSFGISTTDLWVGAGAGAYSLNGWLDEVRISNSARYTANFTPTGPFNSDPNTLLLLHMEGTDASTTFTDDVFGVRTQKGVTAIGNAQIDTAQSKFGGASALFDGTGDYLIVQSNPLPTTGDFTVEFWIRVTSLGTLRPIWSNRDTGGTNRGVLYINATGGITWWNAAINLNFATNISANTWYHIACVKEGSTRRLFIDGAGMVTDSGGYTAGDLFQIGRADYTSTVFSSDLLGYIDEFRVSNSARYTTTFTPSTTPFVNDANTVLLIHANGTDASTFFEDDNGVRAQQGITALGNAQVDTAQSKFGGASALLDGNDYLQIIPATAADIAIGSGDFTIECWVRFVSLTSGMMIDSRGNPQNGGGWCLYVNSNTLRWYSNFGDRITSSSLYTNTWYHIAISRSGNDHKMFIDGTQAGSTYTAANTYLIGSAALGVWIGDNQPFSGNGLNGYIDELRISNTARYTAAFTAPTAPFQNDSNTVLLLHMDGTDGSTVFTDDNGIAPYTP